MWARWEGGVVWRDLGLGLSGRAWCDRGEVWWRLGDWEGGGVARNLLSLLRHCSWFWGQTFGSWCDFCFPKCWWLRVVVDFGEYSSFESRGSVACELVERVAL
ncbi:hypothetical protein M758_5G180700 [Ceratodon purpureus]|uniref:Uncharacterized protein n=1 Tax=Ceratodon purpureus TaxID=3225 RepID=A0A8T0I637_CERPU|nr:hypothetical protein KC19_5G187800 [Ceratodon purpureus]KAG0617314.1 hypothetical protein M758_5G180700 [Ceratodon purpureus]